MDRLSRNTASVHHPTWHRHFALAAPTLAVVLALGTVQAIAQVAPLERTLQVDIPAGALADALRSLATQSGLRIDADSGLTEGRRTAGARGALTARQALDNMLASTGLAASVAADGTVALRTSTTQGQELDKVVIVGTKRAQGRQQATQSVSVLGEQDTIGMQSAFDVVGRIPNVAQQTDGFLPTVRGLDGNGVANGGNGAVTGANPRMSNYIDGVARTYGATPDGQGSFWDLAQIEVYRGAQSTLLGQNALAGAIVQTTRDPVFKDEYAVQVGAHTERTTLNGAFMVNKMLGDSLAIRFTGEAIDGKNAIDYSGFVGSGVTADDRDEFGRTKYGRYRFKALLAPSDALTLKLTLEQERRRNAYTNDLASNSTRREITSTSYGWFDSDTRVAALNANYEINGEWTFDAVLSQQKASTKFGPPIVGQPDPAAFLDFTFDSTETALEPKFVYKARQGRTSAVFGAFIKERERDDLGKPGSLFALTADDHATSQSLFADATLQISPEWDLLAAGRLIDDRQRRNFSAFGGALTYAFDERNRVFLPKFGATYNLSPDAAFSVVAYKGYNPSGGGVSFVTFTPYQYRKETAQTVELVARTQWLDRRLTANANLFFTRLHDTQVSGIGPGGPNDGINVNLARARTRGLEVDVAYRPDAKAKVGFALGLLDTRIIDFGSAANNSKNGNQLGLAPRVTANINGSMEVLPRLVVGGDLAFASKRYTDYENVAADRLPGYGLANVNVQYRIANVTLTGYVNNVFDKLVQFSRFTAFNQAYVNEPRTVGVNVKADF
ncbi:MAG: TonB-dependent receptor [Aquincola sp.]|nr:TonB-dependent receptor [Aquincola sp.]|tara:strand:+ start:9277 stop:11631 length:2355 start_codon:yes stop_codon:yes gene_type:complete